MNAIELNKVTMKFGKYKALEELSFSVAKGSAMALLGENGAGKTTTLRIIAGIYQASDGEGKVLDYGLGTTSSEFYQRIGYVSENQELPMQWTLKQLIDYLKPQYPTWDSDFCAELIRDFELPMNVKIRAMSRGMQMKVSLVSSLSYRPELLLLDEPFSGLDPLVRDELIDGILELMDGGDWTILLSSHDIHEVEQLCDSVMMIERGAGSLCESLDALQSRFRKWTVQLSGEFPARNESWILVKQLNEDTWEFIDAQASEKSEELMEEIFGNEAVLSSQEMSLRDIYLAMAKDRKVRRRLMNV